MSQGKRACASLLFCYLEIMPSRTSYTGTERKLVFAFDVGTTYSGISYVYVRVMGQIRRLWPAAFMS